MNAIQNYVWGRSKPFVYNYDKIRYKDVNSNVWKYMNYSSGTFVNNKYQIHFYDTGELNEYIIFDPNNQPIVDNIYLVNIPNKHFLKELDLSAVKNLSHLRVLNSPVLEKIYVHQDVMNKLLNNTIELRYDVGYYLNSFYVHNHITLANFFVKP